MPRSSPKLVRPHRQTASDQAEAAMFGAILSGQVPAGAQLRLHDLAQELGMSIMPVREALRRLEALGLVEIVAHKGAWVRPVTLGDLRDTYVTRIRLECLALRAAAPRFGSEDAAVARRALEEHAEAGGRGDAVGARDAHERFHFTLYRASGSAWLVRSIQPTWRNSERYRVETMRNAEHVARRADEHRMMLAALELRDADAAVGLLTEHLETSARLVADRLEADSGDGAGPAA